MFFKNASEKITISEFASYRKKICIYRGVGGLGDIIAMRMIFEDLKLQFPEFEITWAVPFRYMDVAKYHPYIDKVITLEDFVRNDYIEVYDVTTICGRYEVLNKRKNEKNRADIWAGHFGLNLRHHNIYMPSYRNDFEFVKEKLKSIGWDGQKKLVAFVPTSAIGLKNMTFEQIKTVRDMTKDFFLFVLNSHPILEVAELGIPALYDMRLHQSLASIELSNYVIGTDTGLMHAAAGYKKPSLATFSFVDGYVYCKYYPTVRVVQLHYNDIPGWCGPCYDYPKCPFTEQKKQKPCQTNITPKILRENWSKLLNTK